MKKLYILLCIVCFAFPFATFALETDTHKKINEYIATNALNGFSLDSYLKNQLGLTNGIKEEFMSDKTKKAWEWVQVGGEYEDIPAPYLKYLRSVNHFHNPITDQGYTGFWGTGVMSGMSSTQWMLLPKNTQTQSSIFFLGNYSWNDVRGYYLNALTSYDKAVRERSFAETFRGIGQLMHVVQDASVPSHTRDDGHALYDYEGYVKGHPDLISSYTPIPFIGTISNGASFIDTNQYDGTNPQITGNNNTIGLSEYTNANFASEDTIFDTNFPHPAKSDTVLYDEFLLHNEVIGYDVYRRYFFRNNIGGEEIKHFAYAGMLYKYYLTQATDWQKTLGLDNHCYNDYAKKLLPRAVGYSAGLLNYFFRGQLETSIVSGGLKVKNAGQEVMTSGNTPATISVYYDDSSGHRQLLASQELTAPLNPGDEITIYFSEPANKIYIVVFQGKLGNEEGAVIGKVTSPLQIFYKAQENGMEHRGR